MNDVYILAVESSCDETSMAIIKNGKEIEALSTYTQISTHEKYGGVVPEIASRMHVEKIIYVLDDLLKQTDKKIEDLNAVAVTYAPGLVGSLLVGIEAAKSISLTYNLPLIKVNHIAGHIYANNLTNTIKYPTLALIVSGGHTDLVLMKKDYDFQVLGSTLDDAIGEAYDKVAKVLEEKYPGGPNVEKLATKGENAYNFPIPMNNDSYDFSFSGLKSCVINEVNKCKMKNFPINKENIACSFQESAIKSIINKCEKAIINYKVDNFIIAGGVSANKYLRKNLEKLCNIYNVSLSMPDFSLCTDNAAMIGAAAYPLYLKKEFSSLDEINPQSRTDLF